MSFFHFVLIFPIAAASALGTSCSGPGSFCAALKPGMVAFVGIPVSMRKGLHKYDPPEVTFQVLENLGGLGNAKTETVVFGDGYRERTEPILLLVDRGADGRYRIQDCFGGLALPLESELAQSFRRGVSSRTPATVSLFVKSRPGWVTIPGVRVEFRGNGRTSEGITSNNSTLIFRNVPPGEYELKYTRANFAPERPSSRLTILPGSCGTANIFLESTSQVSGRYVNAQGEPVTTGRLILSGTPQILEGAPLYDWVMERMQRLFGHRPEHPAHFLAEPSVDGTFRFIGVYPGWYRLAALDLDKRRAPPFGEIYYPGVGAWPEADVIVVQEGKSVNRISFRLPSRLSSPR